MRWCWFCRETVANSMASTTQTKLNKWSFLFLLLFLVNQASMVRCVFFSLSLYSEIQFSALLVTIYNSFSVYVNNSWPMFVYVCTGSVATTLHHHLYIRSLYLPLYRPLSLSPLIATRLAIFPSRDLFSCRYYFIFSIFHLKKLPQWRKFNFEQVDTDMIPLSNPIYGIKIELRETWEIAKKKWVVVENWSIYDLTSL